MALLPRPLFAAPAGVTAIGWRGRATVQAGERTLALGMETRIEPFRRARSTTWLVAAGPASAQALVIEPHGGWTERQGERTPLPPRRAQHERQRFGLYGYVLQALQIGSGPATLTLREPGYPEAAFQLVDGRPILATCRLDAPEEGQPPIGERAIFTGVIADGGVNWPRRIAIEQDGRRAFTLDIDHLTVERA